ncbi:hypothetical protein O1611_g2487 [Lasiodiplodia mahajangana]|uniref:Uncharacterized protein n=1 Tax=Lasiodiplodia mahajangana TaxID=1108764 RepID=A0ACC2JUR4_9PEZI|nr:hypothetical protein O1611_g2487 [Lasiodiplodia mahajangana]
MTTQDGSTWDSVAWRRRFEATGPEEQPVYPRRAANEPSRICLPGELTDKGRGTSLAFGKQLRQLYVDQLGLLPKHLSDPGTVYVRTTSFPRALESVQQALYGLYPPNTSGSAPWNIVIRSPEEETLLPPMKSCARLAELRQEFSRRAAVKWNESDDMRYLSEKLGRWLPRGQPLAIDSRPRLSSVMDTINCSISHGLEARLPGAFYEERVRRAIDRIAVDERFYGYTVSREFRTLGAGEFIGGIVRRMVDQVKWKQGNSILQDSGSQPTAPPKFSLLGCHDYTLGATLASLGCLDGLDQWPPFTSNITFELFRKSQGPGIRHRLGLTWGTDQRGNGTRDISERSMEGRTSIEADILNEYFVRVKYNGRIMTIPGCRAEGSHLDGDESVCTLSAFKSIVDKFTPKSWHRACKSNLGAPPPIESDEAAGY